MPIPPEMTRTRWLHARLVSRGRPVCFVHHPPTAPAGLRRIRMYAGEGELVGTLAWQVCDACGRGTIDEISLSAEWRRQGFGRRLVVRALRDGPHHTWVTSRQSPEGTRFFAAMSRLTGAAFTARGGICAHMHSDRHVPSLSGRVRRSRPVVDRTV